MKTIVIIIPAKIKTSGYPRFFAPTAGFWAGNFIADYFREAGG
jgi:hypothetical protein